MNSYLRTLITAFGTILLIITSFSFGYLTREFWSGKQDYALLMEAHDILLDNGLYDAPEEPSLEYGMIHGMLDAYGDPHTQFIEPAQQELQSNQLEGKFGGIGAELGRDTDGYYVIFPFKDSPASQAGILEGDRLLMVDGVEITPETSTDTVQSAVRGPVGKDVSLTIARSPDFLPQELSIKRAEFPLPSVTWHLDPIETNVGVLKINLTAASTSDEIGEAISDLQARGATHFVLDLRDNPGGLLTAGVDIARLFLEEGDIIMQQRYRDRDVETFQTESTGPLNDIPLVVLINHGSASAAEIAAGALQLHQRSPLIGSPSFGKDTIQLVFVLQDDSSLRVTSARWWIPGLKTPVGDTGLQPDFPVSPAEDSQTDTIMQTAIQVLLTGK